MVSSILPLYLFVHLQLSPVQFGLIDGLYQGVTAVARLASGIVADRWRRLQAGRGDRLRSVGGVQARSACGRQRVGRVCRDPFRSTASAKGIRTAPRDALISLATRPQDLASAFGVHRAMDTVGVVRRPAAGVLDSGVDAGPVRCGLRHQLCRGADRHRRARAARRRSTRSPTAQRATRVSARPSRACCAIVGLSRSPVVAALTSFVVVSDAFLYLLLQWRRGGGAETIPLLYAGTAGAYLVLAAPLGRLADRVGRAPVFLMGQVFMIAVYAGVAWLAHRALDAGAVPAAARRVLRRD